MFRFCRLQLGQERSVDKVMLNVAFGSVLRVGAEAKRSPVRTNRLVCVLRLLHLEQPSFGPAEIAGSTDCLMLLSLSTPPKATARNRCKAVTRAGPEKDCKGSKAEFKPRRYFLPRPLPQRRARVINRMPASAQANAMA